MTRPFTILALMLAIAACAPRLTGTEVGGVIRPAFPDAALPMAEQHCEQYGKGARISGFERIGSITTFDCVAK